MAINTAVQIATTGTLTSGTWLITGYVAISGTSANGQVYMWIGDNSIAYTSRKTEYQIFLNSGDGTVATLSYVGTGTGPFLLVAQSNGSTATGSSSLYCTRLA